MNIELAEVLRQSGGLRLIISLAYLRLYPIELIQQVVILKLTRLKISFIDRL